MEASFGGLLIIAVIAVAAPLVITSIPGIKVPAVVLEIVAGIVVGPSLLGWVEIDEPIAVLSLVGLAFLLFLAGLEIDLSRLRGDLLRLPVVGFAITLGLGLGAGFAFDAIGWVRSPLFVAIALAATSLGLVVPVLKDAGQTDRPLGQLTIAGATVADFGAVILLSLLFSESEGGTTSKLVTLALFVVVIAVVAVTLGRAGRSMRLDAVLVRLQDTTAEIRVRIAVALLIGFVALAANAGLETILGAFIAGAVLGAVDRDTMSHPHFRLKLEAIGYGFLIPVFFVASGVRFDLDALTDSPSAFARVPLFLLALLAVRGVPALLYRRTLGANGAKVAALLQATSLPFIVTAAEIGVGIDAIEPVTAAALISAGLLSVVLFPPMALARLRQNDQDDMNSIAALPPMFAATRESLRTLACYVISPARKAVTGRIGLRATGDGFGTPPFDDGSRILVRGDQLVREPGVGVAITTLRATATFIGVALSPDPGVGSDLPPYATDDVLHVDPEASLALGAWYRLGQEVLDALEVSLAASDDTMDEVQLWPEHFDLATAIELAGGMAVNVGFSPGDAAHAEPYLYVGPHDTAGLSGDFWNEPFGASLPHARLVAADDPAQTALQFIERGLRELRLVRPASVRPET